MLSAKLAKKINEQMNLELFSALLYQQMSAWASSKSFEGASSFLYAHAKEELEHKQRLFNYLCDTGAMPVITALEAPQHDFKSLEDVFKKTLDQELFISKSINELVGAALEEKDFSSFTFLQWFVTEQHEEEKLFRTILEKLQLIGKDGHGLLVFDKELAQIHAAK